MAEIIKMGYRVTCELPEPQQLLRELTDNPPDILLIDLDRLPSHGRDIALAVRQRKSTRTIPLVFVNGKPEKVNACRKLLPDAVYTSRDNLEKALQNSRDKSPVNPIVPESVFASYAGKSLSEKLGFRNVSDIVLVNIPEEVMERLRKEMPPEIKLRENGAPPCDIAIWFVSDSAELANSIRAIKKHARSGPVWIAWPKKASGVHSGLTQQTVRQTGLDSGLVDYKICSIDWKWSGLLFTLKRERE